MWETQLSLTLIAIGALFAARWLSSRVLDRIGLQKQVANRRLHATTLARPCDRLELERQHLQPLQGKVLERVLPPRPAARVLPFPSIQHPLSVYGELMEATA